ncbi:hypothetical protein MJO46_09040 [Shewanella sp. KJ2020]|nr:hypothetical protein [Shewanella sp. KJ2020]MCP3128437.1 hypothetical protein [Shewanella sp. KJ2020]
MQYEIIGVAPTFTYTNIVTWRLFVITCKLQGGLKVSTEQEVNGLDLSEHFITGYSL